MTVGLGILRLAPRDFWCMTPRELAHALAPLAPTSAPPIARAGLVAMMQRFPDG